MARLWRRRNIRRSNLPLARAARLLAPAVALSLALIAGSAAALDGPDIEAAYHERFTSLRSDDVVAHADLAAWLRAERAWPLLEKQCLYLLGLDPDHYNAGVLLREARRQMEIAEQPEQDPPEDEAPEAEDDGPAHLPKAPWLTVADINRIRLGEYGLDGKPEPVKVTFAAKPVQPRFEDLVRDAVDQGRLIDPGWERVLRNGTDVERLQLILSATDLSQASRISIKSDPRLFRDFQRYISPLINAGCARSGCHGGPSANVFRLPTTGRRSTKFLYTTFYLLDQIETPNGRLINRGLPDRSLLAQYMLPPEVADIDHPPTPGGYRALIPDTKDRRYQQIVAWISRLRTPRPDYGIQYAAPDWMKPKSKTADAAPAETDDAKP